MLVPLWTLVLDTSNTISSKDWYYNLAFVWYHRRSGPPRKTIRYKRIPRRRTRAKPSHWLRMYQRFRKHTSLPTNYDTQAWLSTAKFVTEFHWGCVRTFIKSWTLQYPTISAYPCDHRQSDKIPNYTHNQNENLLAESLPENSRIDVDHGREKSFHRHKLRTESHQKSLSTEYNFWASRI